MSTQLSKEDLIFAERLKELRKSMGFTQTVFASLISMDQSELSKVERGLRRGNLPMAVASAKALNTSVDYLLGLTNTREPYPESNETHSNE